MQFMTVSRRRTDKFSESEFAPYIPDEMQQARALYSEGSIRQIWRRDDVAGACILWEADTEASVRELLNRLPLVRAGMLEIVALMPLRPYAGFGPQQSK
jgi:muconolactone delta-isomerase